MTYDYTILLCLPEVAGAGIQFGNSVERIKIIIFDLHFSLVHS